MATELIISAIAVILGVVINGAIQGSTNRKNEKLVEETNAANVEQANLAYERSLPINQVQNMQDAGMSKYAALSALSGGGSYSAPTMQSAQHNGINLDFNAIADRFNNIPSNSNQLKLQQEQIQNLTQNREFAANEEKRKQEQHDFDIWQKLYGKDATLKLDSLSSKIVSQAAAKGVSLDSIDTLDKLVSTFDLSHDRQFLELPRAARQQLFDAVHAQAAENRAIAGEQRAETAEKRAQEEHKDKHQLVLDTLKNSEFARIKSHYEVNKLIADTEDTWQHIEDYEKEQDAREKEYKLRAIKADYAKIMESFGLAQSDFYASNFYEIDENGNVTLSAKGRAKKGAEDAWKFVGTIFGADLLKDILSGIVALAPK